MCEAGVTISMDKQTILLFALLLNASLVCSQWVCRQDSDCSSLSGSSCTSGQCSCEPGQQAVLGGSVCIDVAPYFTSTCIEDFQCGGLFTGFECRKNGNSTVGQCMCQPGFHYLNGRCWRSKEHGQACSTSDECMNPARDPFSLQCNVTCQCAEGYSERQRGICRKTASAAGEACVLNSDCNYPGGVCNPRTFVCSHENDTSTDSPFRNVEIQTHQKISRVRCGGGQPCASPYVCSGLGICVCPAGYYESSRGGCLAELGSPSTPEQCVGFLAEVVGGVCTCRDNFFFDENMRDCVKVSRSLSDSCLSDASCLSFGRARCGPPSAPHGLRSCECVDSIWDPGMGACRYFSGVGEFCEQDSDCLAGDKVIECVRDSDAAGVCACPEGQVEYEGLCLESDLELGEVCQNSLECGGNHTACSAGRCACSEGYRQQETDGRAVCLPAIGGGCEGDEDCVIENTSCEDRTRTCQCRDGFTAFEDICWETSAGFNSSCSVTAECALQSAVCTNGRCACLPNHHYKDGDCYPMIALFSLCTRSSECFLGDDISDRVVCRNGVCQCDFDYPYSEELRICTSSSTTLMATSFVIVAAILSILVQ
ncbi:multiple epidermal growth factor-like domains protein 6 [Danaus plexippus]|uniref:multiple epidermal growth factor-like domains protein 6 n=1 Tax=Danaus plexippus TaxID=13037 RepID=UPI002AAF634E|nr:multiple epidermal growth factor-like domains protein 6 [Danaus plexippus]